MKSLNWIADLLAFVCLGWLSLVLLVCCSELQAAFQNAALQISNFIK